MIYTENTPNPNALKFVSKNIFSEVGVQEFQKKDEKKTKNFEFQKEAFHLFYIFPCF